VEEGTEIGHVVLISREVEDAANALEGALPGGRVAYVALVKVHGGREEVRPAAGVDTRLERIEDADIVVAGEQGIAGMRADEARSAGDEYAIGQENAS
jgi:hypothetical protein